MTRKNDKHHEIVFEDKWCRVLKLAKNKEEYESKLATGEISVTLRQLEQDWQAWDTQARLSFVNAFVSKPNLVLADYKILDFLMRSGDEFVAVTISTILLRHPDRSRVRDFLLTKLRSSTEPKTNFIQSLALVGGAEVARELRALYERNRTEIRRLGRKSTRDRVLEFLFSCAALWQLENDKRYSKEIKSFANHKDEIIKHTAMVLLQRGRTNSGHTQ
jgi:hypothetical protein